MSLINTELKLDPNNHELPTLVTPTKKLTVRKLISVLRDHYQGTTYDIYRSDGSRPKEYAIGTVRTVHTDVVQLRGWLPAEIGAVMWLGLSTAPTTMYVPFYFGINEVSESFSVGGAEYDPNSAFWVFRSLANNVTPYFTHLIDDVQTTSGEFESREFLSQHDMENKAKELYRKESSKAKRFLTEYTHNQCREALELARALKGKLETRIAKHAHEW
jgi:dipeptidase